MMALDKAEVEEIEALAANQPVDGGYTISPTAMQRLVKKKLAFWWDEKPCGYVLTNAGLAWLSEHARAQERSSA